MRLIREYRCQIAVTGLTISGRFLLSVIPRSANDRLHSWDMGSPATSGLASGYGSKWDLYSPGSTASSSFSDPHRYWTPSTQDSPPVEPTQHKHIQGRRRKTVRRLELRHANLVLELPVPSQIVPKGMDASEEMTKMRYTAVTCGPDQFLASEYTLRTHLHCRRTELLICVTMYNEDEVLFCRTMCA